ncbi:hydroxyacid dehydrogenase [Candidatus Dojkabacteria bacterium]|nr:hydroxyacid dehydrogenase [Candidatus Dojkabacteria bacterium]
MKIVFFEIQDWEKEIIQRQFPDLELEFFKEPLTQHSIEKLKATDILSVFIYSKITRQMIHQLPNLKFITTRSTGFDHIDLEACRDNNIQVGNVPYYGENTVAEHTFGLILSLSRNIHKSYVRVQRNNFSTEGLKGFDLKDKTIGVIGTGRIGLHVIRMAGGFGMDILAYDINQDGFLAEVLGFEYVGLDEILKNSDVVTLHVPYNKHTHHMINQNNINKFKKGAILINTSRGGLIETEALLTGLKKEILSGVGLDVIEGEEYIIEDKQMIRDDEESEVWAQIVKDQMILHNENVVFTPHIAFYSQEALERILDTTIVNIRKFQKGEFTDSLV